MGAAHHSESQYYVPPPSAWPLIGSLGLFFTLFGAVNWLHHEWFGPYVLSLGAVLMLIMLFGWFGTVINESEKGLYNLQVDRTFRISMIWFIFSEVCFFGVFFGALFYTRFYSVPSLGGELEHHIATHYLMWPDFEAYWPLLKNPDNFKFEGAADVVETWHLPALNTLILLSSGVTITWAHWGLKLKQRFKLNFGLFLTVLLGVLFLYLQAHEYKEAYEELNLTLESGIYGATFYMLTGFHGLHVTIGTLMLFVVLLRCLRGHFSPKRHFAFEAAAWYWHFVDVVWLFLFIFVYWL